MSLPPIHQGATAGRDPERLDLEEVLRLTAVVHGSVQGVGFRWWTARHAERLGLHARALSVDADSEAGDLLELLDDQQVDGSAERLGTAVAAGPPASTDRPALRPPSPGTTPAALAAGSSSPIAPTRGGVGR